VKITTIRALSECLNDEAACLTNGRLWDQCNAFAVPGVKHKTGFMKYFMATIFITAVILCLGSCKKDIAGSSSTSVIGTWELRHAQTGMIPTIDYSQGNGNMLVFSGSGYERYTNGMLVKTGTYTLVRDDSVETSVGLVIPRGQFTNRIIFDDDLASPKTFVEVLNDELTLLSGFFPTDGGSEIVYQRIQDKH